MLSFFCALRFFGRKQGLSIGLMSELFCGHFTAGILFSWNLFLHTLSTKTWSWFLLKYKCFFIFETITCRKLQLVLKHYICVFVAFIFPLITQTLPTPFYPIQPHITSLTGCFTLCVMQLGSNLLRLFPLRILCLRNRTGIFWSRRTKEHCSTVPLSTSISLAHFNILNICWTYKNGFFVEF